MISLNFIVKKIQPKKRTAARLWVFIICQYLRRGAKNHCALLRCGKNHRYLTWRVERDVNIYS